MREHQRFYWLGIKTKSMIESDIEEAIAQLSELLPLDLCHFRKGLSPTIHPCTYSVAHGMIKDALENGYTIDRTNSDGALNQWDGWLAIDTPESQTFVRTKLGD